MEPIRAEDILSTEVKDGNIEATYESLFLSIASHISDNAAGYAANVAATHIGCRIEIDIPVNGLVTFKIENTELIKERK